MTIDTQLESDKKIVDTYAITNYNKNISNLKPGDKIKFFKNEFSLFFYCNKTLIVEKIENFLYSKKKKMYYNNKVNKDTVLINEEYLICRDEDSKLKYKIPIWLIRFCLNNDVYIQHSDNN